MSEPDWIGPASDCLKANFSEEAGEYLLAAPGRLALLVEALEALAVSTGGDEAPARAVCLIAAYRGETPEAAAARLFPPVSATGPAAVALLHQSGYFTAAQMRYVEEFLGPPPPREPAVMTETTGPTLEAMHRGTVTFRAEDTRVTLKTGEELDLSIESHRERFDRLAFRRGLPPTP